MRAALTRITRRLRTPESSSWTAMVEQHHRMVRAMVMAAPVHPPLPLDAERPASP
jgi:hypothetical protein